MECVFGTLNLLKNIDKFCLQTQALWQESQQGLDKKLNPYTESEIRSALINLTDTRAEDTHMVPNASADLAGR